MSSIARFRDINATIGIRKMRYCFITTVVFMLLPCTASHAAFLNGIETFDGNTLDDVTWTAETNDASISQADELVIDFSDSGFASYTTQEPLLHIGATATVEVTSTSPTGGELVLVDNGDDVMSFSYYPGRQIFFISGNGQSNGLSDQFAGLLESYSLEFTRVSATQLRYLGKSEGMTLVSGFRDVPAQENGLKLSLRPMWFSGQVKFDNVRVVPEPSTITLGILCLCCVSARWRQQLSHF